MQQGIWGSWHGSGGNWNILVTLAYLIYWWVSCWLSLRNDSSEQEIRSVELGVCPMQLFHFWSRHVYPVQNMLMCTKFHPRDAMQARSLLSCSVRLSVCLSVRPSVTFVDHVKTNKHIFEIFSPSGSDTILVFHTKGVPLFRRNPPNRGRRMQGGMIKWRFFFINISLYLRNGYS